MDWCFMIHDKDVDDLGNPETPHLQCFIKTDGRHTLSAVLNYLVSVLEVNAESIQILKAHDEIRDVRYCAHLDSPSKHQYDIMDIYVAKRFHDRCFEILMMDKCEDLSYTELKLIVDTCHANKTLIMARLGLKAYQKYRWCISDLISDIIDEKIQEKNNAKKQIQNG